MTDIDPTNPPVNDPPVIDDNKPTDPPADGNGDTKDWKVEAEKWKSLSRKHEDSEKKLRDEVDSLKTASMSDAEKAIENARKEGASATLADVSEQLVKAALEVAAARKGASLPDLDLLNLSRLTAEDGKPDMTAIEKFVDSLESDDGFPGGADLGIGRRGGSGVRQWTQADFDGKTHAEVVEARKKGHLDKMLGR